MNELQHINSVFTAAFDKESLTRLVRYTFDRDLSAITQASDFTSTVFYLTKWAISQGKMSTLLDAAKASLPENQRIQELTYAPKSSSVVRKSSDYLMDQHESLAIIMLKIEQIERDLEQIRQIVVGPYGDHGVRAVSVENSRKLAEIQKIIERLERAINRPPDVFESARLKITFAIVIAFLLFIFAINVMTALGWV